MDELLRDSRPVRVLRGEGDKVANRANLGLGLGLILSALASGAAMAGPEEVGLLTSYVGDWRGESTLEGGEKSEPFRCRLSVSPGNQSKINYAGRCTLVNMNLSVSGTIAYSDTNKRYEAVMTSNAGFSGLAVGAPDGERIGFDLKDRQKDRGGNDVAIGTKMFLADNSIVVEFEVEFNESGDVMTASVPFER